MQAVKAQPTNFKFLCTQLLCTISRLVLGDELMNYLLVPSVGALLGSSRTERFPGCQRIFSHGLRQCYCKLIILSQKFCDCTVS